MSLLLEELLPMLHTDRITYHELLPGDIWVYEFQAIHVAARWSKRGVWFIQDQYKNEHSGRIRDKDGYFWFDILPREQLVEHFIPPFRPKRMEVGTAAPQELHKDPEIPMELMAACGMIDKGEL